MSADAKWLAEVDARYVAATSATITYNFALMGRVWNVKTGTYTKATTKAQRTTLAQILG